MNVRFLSNIDRLQVGLYGLLLLYVLNLLLRTFAFDDPRARMFPLLFGVPTALFLSVLVIRGLAPMQFDRLLPTRSIEADTDTEDGKLDLYTISVFASFPFIAYLFGFLVAVPLYTFALTSRVCDDIRTVLAITLIVTVGWWILFVELLNVVFYSGVIGL